MTPPKTQIRCFPEFSRFLTISPSACTVHPIWNPLDLVLCYLKNQQVNTNLWIGSFQKINSLIFKFVWNLSVKLGPYKKEEKILSQSNSVHVKKNIFLSQSNSVDIKKKKTNSLTVKFSRHKEKILFFHKTQNIFPAVIQNLKESQNKNIFCIPLKQNI